MNTCPSLFLSAAVLGCFAFTVRAQTVEDALDTTGLTWSAPAGTLIQNDVTSDGVDAVRLARTGTAALHTTITGPATVEFQVRLSTEENADIMEVSVGGLVARQLSGEVPWQTVSVDIPAGAQRLDLIYRKDASTDAGADAVWVDAVRVLPSSALTLEDALDVNFPGSVSVQANATAAWQARRGESGASGGDVLVLGPSPSTATAAVARIKLPVTGRGMVTARINGPGATVTPVFPLRAGYELPGVPAVINGYRHFSFLMPLDSPVPASDFTVSINPGTQVKVDDLRWTPIAVTTPGAALEAESLPWQLTGEALAATVPELAADGVDAVLFYGAGSELSVPVTGPAKVSWSTRSALVLTMSTAASSFAPSIYSAGTGAGGWPRFSAYVQQGATTLFWRPGAQGVSGPADGRLDGISLEPYETVTPAAAADSTGLAWTQAPNSALSGLRGPDAAQDGDMIGSTERILQSPDWVEAAGSGAGRLEFQRRGGVNATVNAGAELTGLAVNVAGPADWTLTAVDVPDGNWAARWQFWLNDGIRPWLDGVRHTPGDTERLSVITDCTAGVTLLSASARRSLRAEQGWQGATGQQLLLEDGAVVRIQTTGSGYLRLRAWAPAGQQLRLGSLTAISSGGWQEMQLQVTPASGSTVVTQLANESPGGTLAVDGISWFTGGVFTAEEGMDTPGAAWAASATGAGIQGWLGLPAPLTPAANPGDGDVMTVPVMNAGGNAELRAVLQGPGWLSFASIIPSGGTLTVVPGSGQTFTRGHTSGLWARDYVEVPSGPQEIIFRTTSSSTVNNFHMNDVKLLPWVSLTAAEAAAAEVPAGVTLRVPAHRRPYAVTSSTAVSGSLLRVEPQAVLEFDLTGPGWLSLDAQGTNLRLNGALLQNLDFSLLKSARHYLPAGTHRLRLSATSSFLALDNFSWQPTAAVTPGEALDLPALTWTVQGPWAVAPVALASDASDALMITALGAPGSTFRTAWPGEGELTFRVFRNDSTAPVLTFSGGVAPVTYDQNGRWDRVTVAIPPGGAELVWTATNQGAVLNANYLLVDEVSFTPYSSVTLAEALDTPGRTWTTGTPPWRTMNTGAAGDSSDVAVSTAAPGLRRLETPVTHPVWVEFDAESSMQNVSLPGAVNLADAPGTLPGFVRRRAVTINATLDTPAALIFEVPHAISPGRLDRISISPAIPLAEALDTPGLTWTVATGKAHGFEITDSVQGGDAAVVSSYGTISTTLNGPGELSVQCRRQPGAAPSTAAPRLLLDGSLVRDITGTAWHTLRVRIPAGTHTLALSGGQPSDMLMLDAVTFLPGGTDSAAQALDFPAGFSGDEPWPVENETAATGGTALRTPAAAAGEVREMPLYFIGRGSLSFSWQAPASAPDEGLELLLDGHPFWKAPPAAAWSTMSLPVLTDEGHRLTLRWRQPAGGGFALLDNLSLQPFTATSLEQALDTTGISWAAEGGTGVAGPGIGTGNDDAILVTSTAAMNFQDISTPVTGPQRVSFRWLSSGRGSRAAYFKMDGNHGYTVQAQRYNVWESVSVDVPPGSFTLRWGMAYDFRDTSAALIDDVRIEPVTVPASLAAALDLTGNAVAISGSAPAWRAVTRPSIQDDDALLGIDSNTPLALTVSGPGILEFRCSLGAHAAAPRVELGTTLIPCEVLSRQPGAVITQDLLHCRVTLRTAGSNQLRIYPNSGSLPMMVDAVTWDPGAPITLAEALDTPGLTWTTGTPPWLALPSPLGGSDYAGQDAAIAPDVALMETDITGPVSISLAGLSGGNARVFLGSRDLGTGADAIFYWMTNTPARVGLRALPASTGERVLLDTVQLTPAPAPPAALSGAGVTVGMGTGAWVFRQLGGGGVPANTLMSYATAPAVQEVSLAVTGQGSLEFSTNGGGLRSDDGLVTSLDINNTWRRHRVEFTDAGAHRVTVSLGSTQGLAGILWLPDSTPLSTASGLSGISLFSPVDVFSVMPDGGIGTLQAQDGSARAMVVNSDTSFKFYTWWQQTALNTGVRASASDTTGFASSSAAEAGPPPSPAGWVPRRFTYSPGSASMIWLLEGSVQLGNFRAVSASVPLAEGLDMPAAVAVTAAVPGTAQGFPSATAAGGDALTLAPGVEQAVRLNVTGPGVLSFSASSTPLLQIRDGSGTVLEFTGGRCHLPIAAGPQEITLGTRAGSTAVMRLDNGAWLPLAFDPIDTLGGVRPCALTGSIEPATWPMVLSGGPGGLPLYQHNFYFPATEPALLTPSVTGIYSMTWALGTQTGQAIFYEPSPVWVDRYASVRIGGTQFEESFLQSVSIEPANTGTLTLSDALDQPGRNFTASAGIVPVRAVASTRDGSDGAAFLLGSNAARTLSTQFTGPGRLRFWWRALTPAENAITCRIGTGTALVQDSTTWKLMDLAVPSGAQTVVWTVAGNAHSAELDGVEFFPQWTFSTWAAQNALATVPAAQRAASDMDSDGISGFAEFAFGLDPGAPDAAAFTGSLTGPESARGLPVLREVRALDGRDYMELHFPRRVNAGLTYQMQTSSSAGPWSATGTVEVLRPLGPGWELCRTRDPVALDTAQSRRFLRLRVTQP